MLVRVCGLCCLLVGIVAFLANPAAASEPRVALVIGNADYGPEIGKLKNPANDARLLADTLGGLGFQVDLVLDADAKAMKQAIKAFGARLRDAGAQATGLFYYAGHGIQVEGENFLVPVGAAIESEADAEFEAVSANYALRQMEVAGNAVNLVFLDACRNNPLTRSFRSGSRGLARVDAPRGSFVGYSTAPGDVAADGDGANSPYALALAEELRRPGISIEEAHRNVRARVLAQSGNKQTPWDSSSLTGAVVLTEAVPVPVSQPVAQAPAAAQQAAVDKEALFWESIKDSADPAEFEAYLAQYPQGSFAGLARTKIEKLRVAAQQASKAAQAPGADAASDTPTSQSAKFVVAASAKAEIDRYLNSLNSDTWALAISRDGTRTARFRCKSGSSSICWNGPRYGANREAVRLCGGASKCFVLYENDKKVVPVEIVTQ